MISFRQCHQREQICQTLNKRIGTTLLVSLHSNLSPMTQLKKITDLPTLLIPASKLLHNADPKRSAQQWTDSGTRIVLIADPVNQTLIVYQSASDIRVLRSGEAFESGDFCGGWKLTVDEAFDIK